MIDPTINKIRTELSSGKLIFFGVKSYLEDSDSIQDSDGSIHPLEDFTLEQELVLRSTEDTKPNYACMDRIITKVYTNKSNTIRIVLVGDDRPYLVVNAVDQHNFVRADAGAVITDRISNYITDNNLIAVSVPTVTNISSVISEYAHTIDKDYISVRTLRMFYDGVNLITKYENISLSIPVEDKATVIAAYRTTLEGSNHYYLIRNDGDDALVTRLHKEEDNTDLGYLMNLLINCVRDTGTSLRHSFNINCKINGVDVNLVKSKGTGCKINGKSILQTDYVAVIKELFSYHDATSMSNIIKESSELALSYRIAIETGIDFTVDASTYGMDSDTSALQLPDGLRIPAMSVGGGNVAGRIKVNIPVRKAGRNKVEAFIADAWRPIRDLVALQALGRANSYPTRPQFSYESTDVYTDDDMPLDCMEPKSLLDLLHAIDKTLSGNYLLGKPMDHKNNTFITDKSIHILTREDFVSVTRNVPAFVAMGADHQNSFVKRLTRSREFLAISMKATGATERTDTDKNGNVSYYYDVKGMSGTVYTISESTGAVYRKRDMQHICIVNGATSTAIFGYDYITGVINALSNDSVAMGSINTLSRIVGT